MANWGKRKDGQAYPKVILKKTRSAGTTKTSTIQKIITKIPKKKAQKSIDIGHWKGQEIKNDMHHHWQHQRSLQRNARFVMCRVPLKSKINQSRKKATLS